MSKIPWTGITWNPVSGCSPISRGCQNCYAKKMAYRLKGRAGYPIKNPFKVTFHPDKLYSLDKKPCMVFVVSMGDLFHPDVKDDWIISIFETITNISYRKHIFQILTKRPERASEL
jgi:protein gp37